jgi:outer membrane protein OmpA-like peptidoglycan-associated protein
MKLAVLSAILTTSIFSYANICGTDYQTFNPTTSGLDFITVQSSETLKPCLMNFGLFLNYAKNSLTYSTTLSPQVKAGEKADDSLLSADLSVGYGISKNWDVGISMPMLLSQQISNDIGVSSYERAGFTEIRLNTKYRFSGNDSGGWAGIFSMNNNLIEDNPFAGKNSGPTFNFELAGDTTVGKLKKWALAANAGYRKRSPGDPLPGVPFLPLKDQWIFSFATSYLFEKTDTKLIMEFLGSRAINKVDQDTDKSLNSSEALVGFKTDFNRHLAWHIGAGTEILDSIGSPDWRVYTGINWTIGPLCENPRVQKVEKIPTVLPDDFSDIEADRFEGKLPEIIRFDSEVLFDFDKDTVKTVYIQEIEDLIRDLKNGGFKKLMIEGHTDSIGSASYNLDLSKRRAANTRLYLINKYHVLPERVYSQGFGDTRPIADNGNYQGRMKNRRVEFKIWR